MTGTRAMISLPADAGETCVREALKMALAWIDDARDKGYGRERMAFSHGLLEGQLIVAQTILRTDPTMVAQASAEIERLFNGLPQGQ